MLKKFRKALGFPVSGNNDEQDGSYAGYDDNQERKPYINPFKKEDSPSSQSAKTVQPEAVEIPMPEIEKPQELPEEFVDALTDIINGNLPQLIKDNLNIDEQKRSLRKTIEPHFRTLIQTTHDNAINEAKKAWETEVQAVNDKIAQLSITAADNEKKAADMRQKLQIEEAKRRANGQKVEEQKARIDQLEAEQEQYKIENKGLLNKLKVMQVYADDAAKYNEQLDDRQKMIDALNTKLAESQKQAAEAAARLQENQKDLDEANSALEIAAQIQEKLQQAEDFKKRKEAEIDQLKELNQKLTKDADLLSKQSADDANALADLRAEIEKLKSSHTSQTKSLCQSHSNDLAAIRENCDKQLAKLKSEKDAVEGELKQALAQLDIEKSTRKDEASEHAKEIKFLKAQHKRTESELMAQIKELTERKPTIGLGDSPAPDQELPGDDIFDNTEPPAPVAQTPQTEAPAPAPAEETKTDPDDLDWIIPQTEPAAQTQTPAEPQDAPDEEDSPMAAGARRRRKKKQESDKQMSLF